jgi:hypothetical protein
MKITLLKYGEKVQYFGIEHELCSLVAKYQNFLILCCLYRNYPCSRVNVLLNQQPVVLQTIEVAGLFTAVDCNA